MANQALPGCTTKPISDATVEDLQKHVQAAVDLELFTIPLYLTAAYSIEKDVQVDLGKDNPVWVSDVILSVAVQEMYHLQLAANLASAYGVKPRFDAPIFYERDGVEPKLPYIHPDYHPQDKVQLGNLEQVIDLMIQIEWPDEGQPLENTEISYDAQGNPCYQAIGDMYDVARGILDQLVQQGKVQLDSQAPQPVHPTFQNRYQVNKVNSYDGQEANSAKNLIHVVVDQGEGQRLAGEPVPQRELDHDQYTEPAIGSRFYAQDHWSHLGRFQLAQENVKNMKFSPAAPYDESTATKEQKAAQQNLNVVFSEVLKEMRDSWTGSEFDLSAMWLVTKAVKEVLATGVTTEFKELDRYDYAAVAKKLDPYWSVRQPPICKTLPQHVCQGLNSCQGQGAPNTEVANPDLNTPTGTKPGDGYCATTPPHTCAGGNDCTYLGGCAFSPYLPAANQPAAAGTVSAGGCQSPISPWQEFDKNQAPPNLAGKGVWEQARRNFENKQLRPDVQKAIQQHGLACPPDALPNKRRLAVDASNKAATQFPETCPPPEQDEDAG